MHRRPDLPPAADAPVSVPVFPIHLYPAPLFLYTDDTRVKQPQGPCRLACKRACGYLTRPGHEQAAMFRKKHARTANGPSDCGSTLCAAIRVSSVSCQGQAAAGPCRLACKRVCGYLTRPGHEQAAMFHKKHARTANGPSDCGSTLCAAIRVSSISCQGQADAGPCRLACKRACGYFFKREGFL